MVIQAQENSITWISNFEERWLPSGAYQNIRVIRTPTKIGLDVGGVVGVVPLLNGDTLQIIPKVGEINFIKMLLRCEGLFEELRREFENLATYSHAETESIAWFVARSFARSLLEINERSLRFDRKFRIKVGTFASGRILPVETATRLIQLSVEPIVFGSHDREYSSPENRMLGKAAEMAMPFLRGEHSSLQSAVEHWARRFSPDFAADDIVKVDRWIAGRKLGGSRGYYVKALSLARVILGQAGLSSDHRHPLEAEGVLVNGASLFERYVRKALVERNKKSGIVITKGGGLRNPTLYTDGHFELEPDYVFQDASRVLLIADAKYKLPDSKDHYQMVCYLTRYGVRTGVFFFPLFEKKGQKPIRHTTPEGAVVWEVSLPLLDLEVTESILAGTLKQFAAD